MQVSIETLAGLERKMTIEVPAEEIESQVQSRLQEAAKTFHMKGFRKGKVPLKVIKNRFGQGVRQEVLGEVMNQSYIQAVSQEQVKPAGQPAIEAKNIEEGQNLEFTATFEVYPEVELADFSTLKVEKKQAEIKDKDIDNMIETLRDQRKTYEEVDRVSQKDDQVNIDFEGTLDGEAFEGGSAKGTSLVLGSGRMIEGFEDGLVGLKKGEQKTLDLKFPENYQNQELAGKSVSFAVTVNNVAEAVLPELNDDFFASFDVKEGGEEAFREEVKKNMARELKNATRNNIKNQVIDGLVELHEIDIPKALIGNEIGNLRQQAMQQFGGGQNIDPSMLPNDLFEEQAKKRVSLGLIMNEIVEQSSLKPDSEKVRAMIEELAESYENPEQVVNWYYGDQEQLANVEAMVLEESVIEHILDSAEVNEVNTDYEDALKPVENKQQDSSEKTEAKDASDK